MSTNEPAASLLVFELAGRAHAIAAESVEEIVASVAITPLLDAPAPVEGVIDYRGRLIAVLDARSLFALPKKQLSTSDHLIVARSPFGLFAFRVDRAIDLVRARRESIERPEGEGLSADVVRLEGGVAVVQDVERLLSAEDAQRIERAIRSAGGAERAEAAVPR